MIDGIEIQSRLLQGIARRRRFILRAHKFKMSVAHAHFGQDGLQKLAIGFRQPLAKDAGGNSNEQLAIFGAFLSCGPKPCRETVGINPPFHVLQNFFPGIHCLKNLIVGELPFLRQDKQVQPDSRKRKEPPPAISTTVEKLWK